MWLTDLESDRLRNLRAVNLRLPSGLILVAGGNGQGKSSLLEAVYLLGTGRSFRTRRLDDLTHWEGGPLRVAGSVEGRAGRNRLGVVMDGAERRLLADGVERRLEDFIGRLQVVDLTAERMLVLRGGPEERRRFLDRGLVGLRPGYLLTIGEYRRVVRHRNALLRSVAGRTERARLAELDVWDERLALAGAQIHGSRREYAASLADQLGETVRAVFPGGEQMRLIYRPSPAEIGDAEPGKIVDILRQTLDRERDRDVAAGYTGQGPHRDELRLELDGVDLRRFGSAGQLRASMVALKLGKLCLLQRTRGEMPLFLMDDFDSDLDEARAGSLAAFLRDGGFQAFVATSKESVADRLGVNFTKIRMERGAAISA